MRGKLRPKPPNRPRRALLPLAILLLSLLPALCGARELRRQMPFIRPLLMGDAYVAVADEASVLLYNPAGLARLRESSIEAISLQFAADTQLTDLLLNPEDVQSQFDNLDQNDLDALIGTSLFYDVQMRLPFLVTPQIGSAYGIGFETLGAVEVFEDLAGDPALQLEVFADAVVLWSSYGRLGDVSLGATFKVINRIGVNKVIDSATLFSTGTLELANDPDFQAVTEGRSRTRVGLDLGLVYDLPFAHDWQPRVGLAALNFGGRDGDRFQGIEFGRKPDADTPSLFGDLPLNVTLGFALSPIFHNVRYTFALDVVDLAETAMPGDSLSNRTRVGFEIGVAPHPDGTALFSVLMGWNATHFGVGILSRVSVFEIGFGRYTVEKGTFPGENPEDRRVLIIAIRI